jgi:hypothetical protein
VIYGVLVVSARQPGMLDYNSYLEYAQYSSERFDAFRHQGIVVLLSNEPIWLMINLSLSQVFDPNDTIQTIVFFSAAASAYIVSVRAKERLWVVVVFLMLPLIIKNYVIHVRQGCAVAVLLVGWVCKSKNFRWLLMLVATMIHASVGFLFILYVISKKGTSKVVGVIIQQAIVFGFAFLVGKNMAMLAAITGARQVEEYDFKMAEASGLGFLYWGFYFSLFISEGVDFVKKNSFETGLLIFYLTAYWYVEVACRIFESGLLVVLIAGLRMTGWRRYSMILGTLFYAFYSWIGRLDKNLLGFGA